MKKVAENLAKATGGDLYEIKPLKPYTSEDLDWTDRQSRSTIEMKDHKSRPETAPDKFSVKGYDTICLGFPDPQIPHLEFYAWTFHTRSLFCCVSETFPRQGL